MAKCSAPSTISCLLRLAAMAAWAAGSSEIVHQRGGLRASIGTDLDAKEFSESISKVLGCGGAVETEELAKIEGKLMPMWNALPKNSFGRIEKQMIRYITYRHFMREFSMVLRGLEPSRPAVGSDLGPADAPNRTALGFVESMLQLRHVDNQGFGLRDVAYVIATLQQLIFEFDGAQLQRSYENTNVPSDQRAYRRDLQDVLEDYLLSWMTRGDPDVLLMLSRGKKAQLTRSIPQWPQMRSFVAGEIKSFQHHRHRVYQRAGKSSVSSNALSQGFTFDDAHQIVGELTRRFSSFWLSECSSMEELLTKMDPGGTGRVPLSRFYSSNMDGDWRFGESEQYLRESGALDESSLWRGNQVIISNYLQSASNCPITTSHYSICCRRECSDIIADIENVVSAPLAHPAQIWELVRNMSLEQGLGDDHALHLPESLRKQLDAVAAANHGRVPLHGRLFAQWLHFVYPRECAFPHKSGSAGFIDFDRSYVATNDEVVNHAYTLNGTRSVSLALEVNKEDEQWMSQWSSEEELFADYGNHMSLFWPVAPRTVFIGIMSVAALAGIATVSKRSPSEFALPTHGKVRCV